MTAQIAEDGPAPRPSRKRLGCRIPTCARAQPLDPLAETARRTRPSPSRKRLGSRIPTRTSPKLRTRLPI